MKRPFKEDAVRLGSEATSRRSPEDDVFAGPRTRRNKDIRVQKTECRAPAPQEKVCRPPARVRQALSAQNFAPSQLPLIPGESLFFFAPICRLPFSPYYKPPAGWRLFAAAQPFFSPSVSFLSGQSDFVFLPSLPALFFSFGCVLRFCLAPRFLSSSSPSFLSSGRLCAGEPLGQP